jgi:hypothetical protein
MKRLLALACAVAGAAVAHVPDSDVQVAQISLALDGARVELRMIPGAQVADRLRAGR